jgi:hypothetical protein
MLNLQIRTAINDLIELLNWGLESVLEDWLKLLALGRLGELPIYMACASPFVSLLVHCSYTCLTSVASTRG